MIDRHAQLVEFVNEFLALVTDMRRAQRRFFSLAPSAEKNIVKEEAKRLEREVDKAIANFKAPSLEL